MVIPIRQGRLGYAVLILMLMIACREGHAAILPRNDPGPLAARQFSRLLSAGISLAKGKHWHRSYQALYAAWRISPDRPDVLACLATTESHLPGGQWRAIAWFRAYIATQQGNKNATSQLAENRIRALADSAREQGTAQLDYLRKLAALLPAAAYRARAADRIRREQSVLNHLSRMTAVRHKSDHSALYRVWKWGFIAAQIHQPTMAIAAAAMPAGKNDRAWKVFVSQELVVRAAIQHFAIVQRVSAIDHGYGGFVRYAALRFYLNHMNVALKAGHQYRAWRLAENIISIQPSALDMSRASYPLNQFAFIRGESAIELQAFHVTTIVRNLYLPMNIGLDFASRYNNRARLKVHLGTWNLALRDYRRVIQIYSHLHDGYFVYDRQTTTRLVRSESYEYALLGNCLLHVGRDKQARAAYALAIEISSTNATALAGLAHFRADDRRVKAMAAFNRMIANGGPLARIYAARANLEYQAGHFLDAFNDSAYAMQRQPHMAAVRNLNMRMAFRLGTYPAALADANVLLKEMPDNSDAAMVYLLRARCYLRTGKPDNALADLNATIQRFPFFVVAHLERMRVELMLQQWNSAAADAAAVIRQHPNAADYQKAVAGLFGAAGAKSASAMLFLGRLYAWGKVTKPNYLPNTVISLSGNSRFVRPGGLALNSAKAAEWLGRSAAAGSARAAAAMGTLYYSGLGVARSNTQAMRWFAKSAAAGCPDAMDTIGWAYQEGGIAGASDNKVALQWFRRAAKSGYGKGMNSVGQCYLKGWGVEKNYGLAMQWYRKAWSAGYAVAAENVGYMYDTGKSVPKNIQQAVYWYKKAAAHGRTVNLGFCYQDGDGVTKDSGKAMECFTLGSASGYDEACFKIGRNYFLGNDTAVNFPRALRWLRKAAAMGDARAMNFIGVMYHKGDVVPKNNVQAVAWYRRAAHAGDMYAMHNLALAYKNARGTPLDYQRAMFWWRRAAALKFAGAECWIGNMLYDGHAVPFSYSAHEHRALAWWRKAADAGSREAMLNMSVVWRKGMGVPVSHFKSVQWKAKTDDAAAMNSLGVCYQMGDGTGKDLALGAKWFRRAAVRGSTDGMINFAEAQMNGRGVKADGAAALKWFQKAAALGSADSMCWLGYVYDKGQIVARDPLRSVAWYKKAITAGSRIAYGNLGAIYAEGDGVTKNYVLAARYFRMGASKGSRNCMTWMAQLYDNGWGVTYSAFKAMLWRAKAGDLVSQKSVAAAYYNGVGVPRNYKAAVRWYGRAASQGSADAMQKLGWCYQSGRGVAVNDFWAIVWYRKSAAKGNVLAAYEIGYLYHKGLAVVQNDRKAVDWFSVAARKGNPRAMVWLGWSYQYGRGAAVDYSTAVFWYRKAAALGNASAMSFMAYCYSHGLGVPLDAVKAQQWQNKYHAAMQH